MSRGRIETAVPEEGVVAALNHDGAGVIRGAKTAFVAGALPGERIRFARVRKHRAYDEAKLLEVLEPSPDRVTPKCAHFGICGGCALQHLAPAAQIASKARELEDNLARIGRVTPAQWLAPITGPSWGYRRRARLGVKYVLKRGEVLVGFRERGKPYIAALERCEVLAPPVDALIAPLKSLIGSLVARERIAQIEVAVADAVTVLVLRNLDPLGTADLEALGRFEDAQGVRIYLQPGGHDTVQPLRGEPATLRYSLAAHDLAFDFEPTDFVQVNAATNAQLVDLALDALQLGADDRVLDLFCGLGNFSLAIARRVREVVGVEGEAGLVARARANAARNGITNAQFHVADLTTPDGGATALAGGFSRVLLDPPRTGALEVLPRVASLAAPRIVYVSCHPGTLARDLGVLCHELGYRLQAAGVIDMFPHTNHVESIAVLERDA